MSHPISKDLHGVIDYSYALIVPLLPEIVGFKKQKAAKTLCRALGAGTLSYSLLTKARWGLLRILPFKTHLAIDLSVSCLAFAAPWVLGFAGKSAARNALLVTGMLGLAATLLTEPEEQQYPEHRHLFI